MVSTPMVPEKKTEQDYGEVAAESVASSGYYSAAEKKALIALMRQARNLGANAIVDLHREKAAYAVSRIWWQTRTVRLVGKAVKISH